MASYSAEQLKEIRGPGGGFGRQSLLKAQNLGWDLSDVQSSIGAIGASNEVGWRAADMFQSHTENKRYNALASAQASFQQRMQQHVADFQKEQRAWQAEQERLAKQVKISSPSAVGNSVGGSPLGIATPGMSSVNAALGKGVSSLARPVATPATGKAGREGKGTSVKTLNIS